MLQEDAKQIFKEPQGWFLPVLEVAACSLAVSMDLILLLLVENKKKKNKKNP